MRALWRGCVEPRMGEVAVSRVLPRLATLRKPHISTEPKRGIPEVSEAEVATAAS